MTGVSDPPETASAYERWARTYATVVRRLPAIGRVRDRAVEALDLDPGDRVVDMGCGPGVNLHRLGRAVGPEGTVVGLDASGRMLRLAGQSGPEVVATIRGDARRPPFRGSFDAVLATFVITLFEDPDAVVSTWWELLRPGGRLALLNMAPFRGSFGVPFNLALGATLALTTPGRPDGDLVDLLDRRVSAAHGALAEHADRVHYRDDFNGGLRLAVGVQAGGDPSQ